jgi:hypothetical protein
MSFYVMFCFVVYSLVVLLNLWKIDWILNDGWIINNKVKNYAYLASLSFLSFDPTEGSYAG